MSPDRPTADHYARALVEAARLTGETAQLQAIAGLRFPGVGPCALRNTPLKARPLAYWAMQLRFPDAHPSGVAHVLGVHRVATRLPRKTTPLARRVAERL